MWRIPNFITGVRLFLALVTFFCLAGAALLSDRLTPGQQFALERVAFVSFVVAAVTDFFDGWLARRLNAVSIWGAILDPIADKVLVCGVVLGLLTLGGRAAVAIPAALILFREFTVSALREVAAGKGVTLPVTLLAKWKTTLQLLALGAQLLVACWAAFSLPNDPAVLGSAGLIADILLWVAAAITVVTGFQYWEQAHLALIPHDRRRGS
ncbi:MAG TPA: CDP-diacylglycerol--glycerol-3-phosphate 3-phosphatidyltransferase [Caulobacteraceae bacterium]|jgi:CDP-diacylglycerol--glycerol-3-phosphate 3-phosphatidyltransferase|nr:CDP-diacylglycerol--glycerol-3-phosphate 3-phosphatidyltransferase [Caulobacteraceae bacterium]